jgi:hypothetical protein
LLSIRVLLFLIVLVAASRAPAGDSVGQVYGRIVENWRWTHYWFGKTGIDDVYSEGKRITAVIFWSEGHGQPIRGLCSVDISLCVAYSGVHLDPKARRTQIPANVTAREAFFSFVKSGLSDPTHLLSTGGLRVEDFQFEEQSVSLPILTPPTAIARHEVQPEANDEAARVKRAFRCTGSADAAPGTCSGGLVFAYYGSADPYWFVLRSCSSACEFRGEAVEELTRGDRHWTNTIGGFINQPRAEVERLKEQIEKAAMFRLQF